MRPIVEIVFSQFLLAHAMGRKPLPIEEFIYEQHDTKVEEMGVGREARLSAWPQVYQQR